MLLIPEVLDWCVWCMAQLYKGLEEEKKKKVRVVDSRVVFLGHWQALSTEEALKPREK